MVIMVTMMVIAPLPPPLPPRGHFKLFMVKTTITTGALPLEITDITATKIQEATTPELSGAANVAPSLALFAAMFAAVITKIN